MNDKMKQKKNIHLSVRR